MIPTKSQLQEMIDSISKDRSDMTYGDVPWLESLDAAAQGKMLRNIFRFAILGVMVYANADINFDLDIGGDLSSEIEELSLSGYDDVVELLEAVKDNLPILEG